MDTPPLFMLSFSWEYAKISWGGVQKFHGDKNKEKKNKRKEIYMRFLLYNIFVNILG